MNRKRHYFIWSVFIFFCCIVTTLVFTSCDKIEQYTVTFDANGGSGTPPSAQTIEEGSSIRLPGKNGLTMVNHSFEGWNTNSDGTGTNYYAGFYYTVNSNITLYAKWEIPTVTFDANGGSGTPPDAQTVNAGTDITLPSGSGLTRTGKIFGGWNTNASGNGTNYDEDSPYTVNNNVTLYANWITVYTVTYTYDSSDSNVTGTPPESHIVTYGTKIYLRSNTFERTGYRFIGWYSPNVTVLGGGSRYLPSGSSVFVYNNITFYARWQYITEY
ncbi:MAG: InlB B-repeat-containing protein [Treponema sp.]|jgi:uncharacterized repeat protein (TIGR02543 family)|nr:InlB B-repeat-containing protein [Treponema sp.]